jgi:HD-GYP domain-containing protein (c-di-GMP phosphodiesterase class II)
VAHTDHPRTIADLEPGDHLCCLYETEEEHRAVLTPFLRQGLERGEKVLYIADAHTPETILGYLRDPSASSGQAPSTVLRHSSGQGLNVEPHLARGQLVILTCDDAYLREGIFGPEGMIALLRADTERALAEGYSALRVTGEMTWALRGLPGSERLIEYETRLSEFLAGSKCLAMCQYDQRRFTPEVLLDVLRTHPIAIVGTVMYDNFYYIPPADLLGGDLPAATLRHWVQNLAERKRAERELQQSLNKLQVTLEGTIHALASAVEMRDPYTAGHQRGVTRLACAIANEMGLPEEQIEGIRMAGLIHDIGKINVPAEILSKPSALNGLEFGLIKTHPQVGCDILNGAIEFPWPIAQIVLQHHERMDGSGYPVGLSGEEIILEARILAVADVVEAMASHRPYRPARGMDQALEEISQNRGILYDPEVVAACLRLFTEKGFKLE